MNRTAKRTCLIHELPQMRVNLGITQEQVALTMKTSQPTICRLENQISKGQLPKWDTLRLYAKVLGFDLSIRCVKKEMISKPAIEGFNSSNNGESA